MISVYGDLYYILEGGSTLHDQTFPLLHQDAAEPYQGISRMLEATLRFLRSLVGWNKSMDCETDGSANEKDHDGTDEKFDSCYKDNKVSESIEARGPKRKSHAFGARRKARSQRNNDGRPKTLRDHRRRYRIVRTRGTWMRVVPKTEAAYIECTGAYFISNIFRIDLQSLCEGRIDESKALEAPVEIALDVGQTPLFDSETESGNESGTEASTEASTTPSLRNDSEASSCDGNEDVVTMSSGPKSFDVEIEDGSEATTRSGSREDCARPNSAIRHHEAVPEVEDIVLESTEPSDHHEAGGLDSNLSHSTSCSWIPECARSARQNRKPELFAHSRECESCGPRATIYGFDVDYIEEVFQRNDEVKPTELQDWLCILHYLEFLGDVSKASYATALPSIERICYHFTFGAHRTQCEISACPLWVGSRRNKTTGGDGNDAMMDIYRKSLQWKPISPHVEWLLEERKRLVYLNQQTTFPGCFPLMKLPWEMRNEIFLRTLKNENYSTHPSPVNDTLYALLGSCRGIRREALPVFKCNSTVLFELHSTKLFRMQANGFFVTLENYMDGLFTLDEAFRHYDHIRRFHHVHVIATAPPTGCLRALNAHWKTVALNTEFLMRDVMDLKIGGVPRVKMTMDLALGRAIEPAFARPDASLACASGSRTKRWLAMTTFRKERGFVGRKEAEGLEQLPGLAWVRSGRDPRWRAWSENWNELYPDDEVRAMALLCQAVTDLVTLTGRALEVVREDGNVVEAEAEGYDWGAGSKDNVSWPLTRPTIREDMRPKTLWPARERDGFFDIKDLCTVVGSLPGSGSIRLVA